MSKKIHAGDTLTVGDLTDDYLGAVIEVGPVRDVTYRFRLARIERLSSNLVDLMTADGGGKCTYRHINVKIITPPQVVQPEEPTALGQCIWIEEYFELLGVVANPGDTLPIRTIDSYWMDWEEVLSHAGERQIVVSDPPRWPDVKTPEVPKRIETREEWDALDADALHKWEWIDVNDVSFGPAPAGGWSYSWRSKGSSFRGIPHPIDRAFPLTRGERVK